MMRIISTISLIFMLAGCATNPVLTANAELVPSDQVIEKEALVKTPEKDAEITISRDSGGFIGRGNSYRIYIDGKPIADLDGGEYFTAYIKSGRHILAVRTNGPFAGGVQEIEINVGTGESRKYRTGANSSGEYFISPTSF